MKKLATLTAAAALVAVFGFATDAMAMMPVHVVNDDAGGDGNVVGVAPPCKFASDHQDINAAISVADAGDIIFVCPGVYEENVVVDVEDLMLIGLKGPEVQPCIAGTEPTQACVVADTGQDAITITANGVMVLGLKVTGNKDAFGDPDNNYGIHVRSTGNLVRKNTVFDNGNHGIFLATTFSNNSIEANNVHDNFADGIHVASTPNTFTENKVHDSFDDGFEFEVAGNTVNGNRSNDNGGCGFNGDANYNPDETKEGRNRANKNDGGNFCTTVSGTGSIKGRVTELGTGDNIAKAFVTTGALSDTTKGNGKYIIDEVPVGVAMVTVTASKIGCANNSAMVTVVAGASVPADIELDCS